MALWFLAALLVGYISTLPTLKVYHDSTATKRNTLTKTSQDIMKQIDGSLKITSYMNLLDDNYAIALPSQLKSDYERFEKYIRFKPDTKMEYVYYYDEANSQLISVLKAVILLRKSSKNGKHFEFEYQYVF